MPTMLLLADVVVALDRADTLLRPGYVVIRDDRTDGKPFDTVVDLPGRLVMPGLVNAHTHTPMVLFRGLAEAYSLFTFDGWYNGIRVWEQVMEGDMVPPAVAVSCAEMIRTGTTCFADQYFYMDRIVPVVRESGLRATLAYGIVEMGDPSVRERELASAAEFLAGVQGDPRLQA